MPGTYTLYVGRIIFRTVLDVTKTSIVDIVLVCAIQQRGFEKF